MTVDSLGGDCNLDSVAEKLGRKKGGAFTALYASAVKYGFVTISKGRASATELFRSWKLAYTEEDERAELKKAFLNISIFEVICERFEGKEIPIQIFDKFLIREFDVPEKLASRVAGYFIEGVRMVGILDGDTLLRETEDSTRATFAEESAHEDENVVRGNSGSEKAAEPKILQSEASQFQANSASEYQVRITGPDMDSLIGITDSDDLDIVNIMLRKVSKRLSDGQQTQKPSGEMEAPPDG